MKTKGSLNTGVLSDEQLLTLLSQRREEALKELYDRYWNRLYIRARKVLDDKNASEDAVQEVFIDLWEQGTYDHIQNFQAWLHQAVRYKTLMILRKNHITDRHLKIFGTLTPDQQSPMPEFRLRELKEEIVVHMAGLPPRCREVFYKSRFENLENQEIADQLNISKRTVETHISHALRYLRGIKELLILIITLTCMT